MIKSGQPIFAESVSPDPVAKPLNLRIPTQSQRIMEYVRYEQMRAMERGQVETFEEADDFELDDEEWVSPYEEVFEAPAEAPGPAPATPVSGAGPLPQATSSDSPAPA